VGDFDLESLQGVGLCGIGIAACKEIAAEVLHGIGFCCMFHFFSP
jgi:hypothetical protein